MELASLLDEMKEDYENWKAGIAIVARSPMITTTIIISTRVNPFLIFTFIMKIMVTYSLYNGLS